MVAKSDEVSFSGGGQTAGERRMKEVGVGRRNARGNRRQADRCYAQEERVQMGGVEHR